MNKTINRFISIALASLMVFSFLPMTAATSYAAGNDRQISYTYGVEFQFDKISNPGAGSGMADGINTNDETGYQANRLNSYAWAVAARGDYIYIGTNRTLFGSALNAVAKTLAQNDPNTRMTKDVLNKIYTLVSMGDVPLNLKDEDYIPQIIRFDVKNGKTKVIYQPSTKKGEDGNLYYTDKNGNIIPDADVASETASFRSVVNYKGNLYFGSLGVHMLQLVRVDSNDEADVAFQTLGQYSSLRAGCTYDAGDGEVLYFGGQDTTYGKWRREYGTQTDRPLPIVIRYLDPSTAGTDQENWNGLIADYDDFGKYAKATVYSSGGGNVWDLCSYNGKLYLILAYDRGWALFRGEKGGSDPNEFGWTWTEVVGDDGAYPLAMDESIGEANETLAREYGCSEYGGMLNGTGLLDSTATPFVYKGKMYIGTFDNATCIQSQTVTKFLTKLKLAMDKNSTVKGPTLKQIYAPIYEVLKHPQRIWVMDENEKITAVEGANALLKNTTNDYVWRFIEHDGRLYTGTFDSATAYNYFLGLDLGDILNKISSESNIPARIKELFSGKIMEKIRALLDREESLTGTDLNGSLQEAKDRFMADIKDVANYLEKFYQGKCAVEKIVDKIKSLRNSRADISAKEEKVINDSVFSSLLGKADTILGFFDIEGLVYWAKARALVRNDVKGFDLMTTTDGEKWDKILEDGLKDRYNYGGRTFTILNDELYIGTANPYYGAQLWKVTDLANEKADDKGDKGGKDSGKKAAPAQSAEVVSLKLKAGKTVNITKSNGAIKSWTSSAKKVATVVKGKVTALKKGSSTVNVTFKSGKKFKYNVTVTTSPKLAKKSIKVKVGKKAKVRIIGKAPGVKNTYKKTKYAKITSKRTAKVLKVKGLKKGKTVLKIKVNGVKLKLKVTVK